MRMNSSVPVHEFIVLFGCKHRADNDTLFVLGTHEKDVEIEVEEYDKKTNETKTVKHKKKALGIFAMTRVQLLVLRALVLSGTMISLQADGTYKLVVGGWALMDLGTHSIFWKNYKYTHSFFQLVYMFCFTECFETYEWAFMLFNAIPATLFGIAGGVNVGWGGLDRSTYIARAYVSVWPLIILLLCWPHIARKVKEGHFRKKLRSQDNWPTINKHIRWLHDSKSDPQFRWLAVIVLAFWRSKLNEAAFANYFEEQYVNSHWGHWHINACRGNWLGGDDADDDEEDGDDDEEDGDDDEDDDGDAAMDDGDTPRMSRLALRLRKWARSVVANQNGIESGHRSIKLAVGAKYLRARTAVFLNSSLPKIARAANRKIKKELSKSNLNVSYEGDGPLDPDDIRIARDIIEDASPAYLKVPAGSDLPPSNDVSYYVINDGSIVRDKNMTPHRMGQFLSTYLGKSPFRCPSTNSSEGLSKLHEIAHGANLVVVIEVSDPKLQNPFMRKRTISVLPDAAGSKRMVCILCTCPPFAYCSNTCPHVIAMAHELRLITFESELQHIVARKKQGRPLKTKHNQKDGDKLMHDVVWYRRDLSKALELGKALKYFKHRVARDFIDSDSGKAKTSVGKILMYDKASKKWTIKYDGHTNENWEEIGINELAQGLADANSLGCDGPDPVDVADINDDAFAEDGNESDSGQSTRGSMDSDEPDDDDESDSASQPAATSKSKPAKPAALPRQIRDKLKCQASSSKPPAKKGKGKASSKPPNGKGQGKGAASSLCAYRTTSDCTFESGGPSLVDCQTAGCDTKLHHVCQGAYEFRLYGIDGLDDPAPSNVQMNVGSVTFGECKICPQCHEKRHAGFFGQIKARNKQALLAGYGHQEGQIGEAKSD